MKMIGMSVRSASCCCSSRPLSPGSVTSSTRQQGTVARGRDRNSCADANVSGRQPALLISSSSDSRTETSSSTTKTIDVTSGMVTTSIERQTIAERHSIRRACDVRCARSSSCLPHPKRGVECVEQGRFAERLEQALDGPIARAGADGSSRRRCAVMKTIGISCRRRISSCCRSGPDMPGIATSRIRQLVSPTTSDARNASADENACGGKAELPQQVWQRLAHGLVVVDDRHE